MTQQRWDVLIAAVLCAGLGVASGFYAAGQSGSQASPETPTEDPPAEDDHGSIVSHGWILGSMGRERWTPPPSPVWTIRPNRPALLQQVGAEAFGGALWELRGLQGAARVLHVRQKTDRGASAPTTSEYHSR